MACVREPREKLCVSAFHPEKPARKLGGEAVHFGCPFFEFWESGTRSRIVFLQVFARRPLILSDDITFAYNTVIVRHGEQSHAQRPCFAGILEGDLREGGGPDFTQFSSFFLFLVGKVVPVTIGRSSIGSGSKHAA